MSDTVSAAVSASKPLFQVVKGQPSDTEIAALTAVFSQLAAQARAAAAGAGTGERNLWGARDYGRRGLPGRVEYNPNAFRDVRYY